VKPDILAQANLDGGGNTDENRRLKSPMPVTHSDQQGQDLQQATRRVQELEALQRQLLTQMQQSSQAQSAPSPRAQVEPEQKISGAALANRALASIQKEAQISRDVDDYNKRPRKLFVGARAQETSTALYLDAWRQRIERLGSINYPEEARGKLYGTLQMTVTINADGSVAAVELERSSGYKVIDAAAEHIVRMGAPYAALPPELRRNFEQLVITRTWNFVRGDRVVTD
jgi:protein TonB